MIHCKIQKMGVCHQSHAKVHQNTAPRAVFLVEKVSGYKENQQCCVSVTDSGRRIPRYHVKVSTIVDERAQ